MTPADEGQAPATVRAGLRGRHVLLVAGATVVGALAAVALLGRTGEPQDRHITVFARQYAFDPPVIRANQGDRLHLKLVSLDVVHGFFLEGHDVDAEIRPQQQKFTVRRPSQDGPPVEKDEIMVVADKPGKYRYRCSHTCGSLHPFMNGELIVAPNHVLHAGLGGCLGLLGGFVLVAAREGVGRKRGRS